MTEAELRSKVRYFIRDRKSLNKLLGSEYETDDDTIDICASLAISYINNTQPYFITFGSTVDEFSQEDMLVLGTSLFVLQSSGIGMDREFLQFNDGGISLILDNKSPFYHRQIALLAQQLMQMVSSRKIAMNINGFIDSTDSKTINNTDLLED